MHLEKTGEAIKELEQVVDCFIRFPSTVSAAGALSAFGLALWAKGKKDDAEKYITRGVQKAEHKHCKYFMIMSGKDFVRSFDPDLVTIDYYRFLFLKNKAHENEKKAAWTKHFCFIKKQTDVAIRCLEKILRTCPLMESAYQQIMVLYAERGMHNHALQIFKKCRKTILKEIGSQPDIKTLKIYNKIRELIITYRGYSISIYSARSKIPYILIK